MLRSKAITLRSRRQGGAVLLVGLIMVLLMTIVGLAAIRGSGLQEAMAGNMRERNIAFQLAEAGLREGEELVDDQVTENMDFSGSETGLYPDLSVPDDNPFGSQKISWSQEEWASRSLNAEFDLPDDSGLAAPIYLLEKLSVLAQQAAESTGSGVDLGSLDATGLEIEMYRISARGVSPSGDASAVVQSTFRKK